MKKILLWIAVGAAALDLIAQSPDFMWAKQIGGSSDQFVLDMVVDASGNTYSTGYFQGTTDFDPGSGISNLTSASASTGDVFVLKLNTLGVFQWAVKVGGTQHDYGSGICLDASGNVYVVGQFSGTMDFDPGIGTSNLTAPGPNVFVWKLGGDGTFKWAQGVGGPQEDSPGGICIDNSGNVIATGIFKLTADFDPGPNTFNITAGGIDDIFALKLSTDGNFIWAKHVRGNSYNNTKHVKADKSDNLYVGCFIQGRADFDPGADSFMLVSKGNPDMCIWKLNPTGNFIWVKQMAGKETDYFRNMCLDASANIIYSGTYDDTCDFDPGPGVFNLVTKTGAKMFVSKLDSAGKFLWAEDFNGGGLGYGISTDAQGNIFYTGTFRNTMDFDPGAGIVNLSSLNQYSVFFVKLNPAGVLTWARAGATAPTGSYSEGRAIGSDAQGNIYTAGVFSGKVDFDQDVDVFEMTGVSADVFVHKLSPATAGIASSDNSSTAFYPNPSTGIVYFSLQLTGPTRVEIYDVIGQLKQNIILNQGSYSIDLGSYPSGIYQIKLTGTDEIVRSGKVIKIGE